MHSIKKFEIRRLDESLNTNTVNHSVEEDTTIMNGGSDQLRGTNQSEAVTRRRNND